MVSLFIIVTLAYFVIMSVLFWPKSEPDDLEEFHALNASATIVVSNVAEMKYPALSNDRANKIAPYLAQFVRKAGPHRLSYGLEG